jgi:hypothetical protein
MQRGASSFVSSPDIIRVIKIKDREEMRNAYTIYLAN